MSSQKRILFSARDPGAVGHNRILIPHLLADGRFEVALAASGVAREMLYQAGFAPIPFSLPDGRDFLEPGDDPAPLLKEAQNLLRQINPDAVFTSLSSLGVGIDEALLATAKVPTFALQDFWGDVNLGLGVPAGLYLVMDDFAVDLSQKRWGVKALAVGAPKYLLYQDMDIPEMRTQARGFLGVSPDDRVIGWFGQSPEIPGHEAVFHDFLNSVAALEAKPKLILREHPKFPQVRVAHIKAARNLGLSVQEVTGLRGADDWLATCDLVTTAFSICGLDHAYLSSFCTRPLGTVLYLATNAPIRKSVLELCGMRQFPTVDRGLGCVIEKPDAIVGAMRRLLTDASIYEYHRRSKQLSAGQPLAAIVECLLAYCDRSKGNLASV